MWYDESLHASGAHYDPPTDMCDHVTRREKSSMGNAVLPMYITNDTLIAGVDSPLFLIDHQ